MGWLVLSTEDIVANHFSDSSSPLEVWKLFQKSFVESWNELDLTGIKFEDCQSMDNYIYIGRIMESWKAVQMLIIIIEDRVVALLLLGELGQEYQPFIICLQF